MSVEQARNAIRWEIVLVIAASLGVSSGMETSGASGEGRHRRHTNPGFCFCFFGQAAAGTGCNAHAAHAPASPL